MSIELPDAPVIITGTLLVAEPIPVIDQTTNKRTGEVSGAKATIMVAAEGEVGFAKVKLSDDDLKHLDLRPNMPVSWLIVNRPWAMGDRSGMASAYLREVNGGDLDRLGSQLAAANKKAA